MPKEKKPRKKPAKARKINKPVLLVQRLVNIPEIPPEKFWMQQVVIAKKYLGLYGDDILKLDLGKKLDSLGFLGYVKDLETKIAASARAANYTPAEYEKVEVTGKKVGKDAIIKRKPNLRQWLDQEKTQ